MAREAPLNGAAYVVMKRSRLSAAIACAFLVTIGGLTALPILAVSLGAAPQSSCSPTAEVAADDGTPSILGPSGLTVSDLRAWWASTGRGQPARLGVAIGDLLALYLSEGDAEGVRGDMALAQAVLETGHFTNSDTSRNNYAGIAHYDGTSSGAPFASPIIGVRAQIQLLKKYALGNDAPLANQNVAPRAGASSTTWGGLAGTWASATNYWTVLNSMYGSMLAHAASDRAEIDRSGSIVEAPCTTGVLAATDNYTLPLERRWYDQHPQWFTKPHHDYPAADIPVPTGTPLFAVTSGTVVGTPTSGKCGVGILFNGDDGAQYVYCHGQPGSQKVRVGDRVTVSQHILDSASTGNSTGPHLHFGIRIDGVNRCPQPLLAAIAEGRPPSPSELPTSGCSY